MRAKTSPLFEIALVLVRLDSDCSARVTLLFQRRKLTARSRANVI